MAEPRADTVPFRIWFQPGQAPKEPGNYILDVEWVNHPVRGLEGKVTTVVPVSMHKEAANG